MPRVDALAVLDFEGNQAKFSLYDQIDFSTTGGAIVISRVLNSRRVQGSENFLNDLTFPACPHLRVGEQTPVRWDLQNVV